MISWGLEVNDYGNAQLDANGNFRKVKNAGMTEAMWEEMVKYAEDKGWKKGDYKNLNLVFENRLLGQPQPVRERMVKRVEEFVYTLLTEVFNAQDTAPLAIAEIVKAGSHDLGPKASRIEDPAQWSGDQIAKRVAALGTDKGPAGNFDD